MVDSGSVTFIDAYRYMGWPLAVPLHLIETLVLMKFDDAEFSSKAWPLGFGSVLSIISDFVDWELESDGTVLQCRPGEGNWCLQFMQIII